MWSIAVANGLPRIVAFVTGLDLKARLMTDPVFIPNASESPATLLTIRQIAGILGCSTRHVQRLADGGKMPRPIRLGTLLRWPRQVIEDWVAASCPVSRTPPRAPR